MKYKKYLIFLTLMLSLLSFFQVSIIFYFHQSFNWSFNFSFLILMSFLLLNASYFLGDSLIKINKKAAPLKYIGSLCLGLTSIFSFISILANLILFLGLNSSILASIIAIFILIIFSTSLYLAKQPICIKEINIALKSSRSLRVLQISDLHLNGLQSLEKMEAFCNSVNALNVDVIVFTGDLMDLSAGVLKEELNVLKNLNAKIAKLAVSGNHDYYLNDFEYPYTLESLGFHNLDNKRCKIKGMTFIGLPDKEGCRHGIKRRELLELLPTKEKEPVFLLDHRPESFEKAVELGVDFQFSGHTHWGQIPPWDFLVHLQYKYAKGLKTYKNSQIYISKGSGLWGPQLCFPSAREAVLFKFN